MFSPFKALTSILLSETCLDCPPPDQVLAEFEAKGGVFVRMENDTLFQLRQGDVVFPACSAGQNRSQTIWASLLKFSDKITLMPPHATQYGLDPYNDQPNWLKAKEALSEEGFIAWAGLPKSEKFGWDLFPHFLEMKNPSQDNLSLLKDYFNKTYYHPEAYLKDRRIYVTFQKNAHIHLFRLNQTNESLEKVVVLFFPLDDLIKHPLPEWETEPGSLKSYKELSKLILKHLGVEFLK